jgi:4-amino-4-deoxy-L-arabinose transferase-like glycosyltransferase
LSNRSSFALAVLILLLAMFLRFFGLATLPPGFHGDEVDNIRIAETVRTGRVEVFYNLHGEGREGLYQMMVTGVTSVTGGGLIGYRILSVWAGLLTVSLLYALGKRMFGPLAGLAASALLAVGMLPIILSRTVGPDVILVLYVTAVLLALAQGLPISRDKPHHEPGTAPFAALGLLLGLGFYVHPASFTVTLMSMLYIAYSVITRQPMSRRTVSYTWFAVVVMIVVATPYLISSLQSPELGGAARLFETESSADQTPLQAILRGLSGIFFLGDANPVRNLPERPLFDLVSGLLLAIGLIVAIRYWRKPRFMLILIAVAMLAPVALLSDNSPNFLSFAPLLPVLALLFGLGVSTISSSLGSQLRPLAIIGLLGLLGFNLYWTAKDLFESWPQDTAMQQAYHARLAGIAHYVDGTGATPTVICTPTLRPTPGARALTNPQLLALMMHNQRMPIRYADCGIGLVLTQGGEREQVVLLEPDALANIHPYLRRWLDQGELIDAPDVPQHAIVVIDDVSIELADTIGRFTTTAPVAYAPEAPGGSETAAPPIRLGGNISFLGYERTLDHPYAPGDVVPVITYWRVDGIVPTDLTLFTHALSDPTVIAVQRDIISVLPEQLANRDVFIQVTFLQLPFSMPEGTYRVSIGAYEDNTDVRLNVFDGEEPRGTRLFIGQFVVEKSNG